MLLIKVSAKLKVKYFLIRYFSYTQNVATHLKKTEFIEKPEIILSKEFDFKSTSFGGIYFGENVKILDNQEISEYYDSEENNQNLELKNGWILMENGIQYVMENGLVKMIRIKQNGLKNLIELNKEQIKSLIGKLNRIKNDGIM